MEVTGGYPRGWWLKTSCLAVWGQVANAVVSEVASIELRGGLKKYMDIRGM